MKCLFCVKYVEDERQQVNINHSHHTYQQDLQYVDPCLKRLSLCNSGTRLSWSSSAELKLIRNSHVNRPSNIQKIVRRMMLPFQKKVQCHRMNYIKLAEAHLQDGHRGNYWSSSDIHLRAYTLVNQLLFSNEMSSDSFFLHLKKLSERTKESFTFLSAFINSELHLL